MKKAGLACPTKLVVYLVSSFLALIFSTSSLYGIQRKPHCWVVDTTGAEGDSLQAAINETVSNPGIDTVLVHNGTYHLFINDNLGLVMADSIELISMNGAAQCTLTALSEDSVGCSWHVIRDLQPGTTSLIKGFTIRRGRAIGPEPDNKGGGILLLSGASPKVDSCVIENNYSDNSGGGVYSVGCSPVFTNCSIRNNVSVNGGGLLVYGGMPSITNNIIENNQALRGGGIFLAYSFPTVAYNIIQGNIATQDGGGISGEGTNGIITNNIIKQNRAEGHNGGGGIANLQNTLNVQLTIVDNLIENNSTTTYGGGILLFAMGSTPPERPRVVNCVINGNTAQTGGGIALGNCDDICTGFGDINGCNIINNSSFGNGGGIQVGTPGGHGSAGNVTKSSIYHNVSNGDGGGIYIHDNSSLTIDSSFVGANSGSRGGGFFNIGSRSLTVGNCFITDNGNLQNTRSGFAYNAASAGTFSVSYSNTFYNTFQPDTEIYNGAPAVILIQNNFWWDTTATGIASMIYGPNNHTPWAYTFIPGVPGEPTSVDSVRNYASDWATIVNQLNAPDTLYLRICGQDRNATLREGAVAILKSRIYPTGIAVALAETDTNTGIYQGKAYVVERIGNDTIRIDDIKQVIKVNSAVDTIRIITNMDTTKQFVVYYKSGSGIAENPDVRRSFVNCCQLTPNPFTFQTLIRYQLSAPGLIKLAVYNIAGQVVKVLVGEPRKAGAYQTAWDGRDALRKPVMPGVYFVRLETTGYSATEKVVLVR